MMKRVWRRSPYLLAFQKVRINKTRLGKDKSCLGYLTKWAKDCGGGAATTTKDTAGEEEAARKNKQGYT